MRQNQGHHIVVISWSFSVLLAAVLSCMLIDLKLCMFEDYINCDVPFKMLMALEVENRNFSRLHKACVNFE
jgi:hypothetical protein